MNKRGNIAVFLAGWNSEYQTRTVDGICERAKEAGYTVSIFTCQAGKEISDSHVEGENQIFGLANLERFDGVIMASHTFWLQDMKYRLIDKIRQSNIPAISLEERADGLSYVGIDNYNAMYKMVAHLHEVHGFHRMYMVGGLSYNPEGSLRKDAFVDYMDKMDYPVEDDQIWYGKYAFDDGQEFVDYMMQKELPLPEAIVCANDKMAIGVCSGLKKLNIRVPEDVVVTGFDGASDSELYIPGITTVHRPQEELGYVACDMLLHSMKHGKLEQRVLETDISVHESCGCKKREPDLSDKFVEYLYLQSQETEKYTRRTRNMDDEMMECETLQELVFCIRQNLNRLTSENIYLCLNQSVYYEMTGQGNAIYRKRDVIYKYDDKIYVTRITNADGVPVFEPFEREEIFPELWKEQEPGYNFLFVPVHFRDNCLGYLTIAGHLDTKQVPSYYAWIRNISNALEKLKGMLLLKAAICNIDNLSIRDSLTGVYNRTGINRFVVDMVRQANSDNKSLLFVFADVNKLKHINDVYGHEAGDQAICMVADALQETFGNHEVIIRYGGDEFLIVSSDINEEQLLEKRTQVEQLLERWSEKEQLAFPLSVSIGCYSKDENTQATMEQYINLADEDMYKYKSRTREHERQ